MNIRSSLTAVIAATAMAGCAAEVPAGFVAGSPEALVVGTVDGITGPIEELRVALIWTYWDPADCTHSDTADGYRESGCSGSTLATAATAIIDPTTHGFTLTAFEAPPEFVHGYQTDVAEAVIALLPTDGLSSYDVRAGLPETRGFSTSHMVVYVPQDLPSDRYEAQSLGGAALGAGFHLVREFDDGGAQIEGTVGPNALCDASDCTVYTARAGELAPSNEAVVIRVGADVADMPALFL